MDWSLSASEGLAFGAGALQGAAALVFALGRKLRPGWGLGLLAWTYGLAAALNLLLPVLRWTAPDLRSPAYLLTAVLGITVVALLPSGVRQFMGRGPVRPWAAAVITGVVFVGLSAGLRVLGLGLLSGAVAASAVFVYLAVVCIQAGRARHQHAAVVGPVVVALLSYPLIVAVAVAIGADPLAVRHWGSVPFALVGVSLMVVALWRYHVELHGELARRERAEAELRLVNQSLEQRVSERTAELNEMVQGLESFNRMVSHDLRGPLGGLSGLSRLAGQALADGESARVQRMLGLIGQETERLTGLVEDLLTLARVTHAELHTQPQPLDEVLREAMQSLGVSRGEQAVGCILAQPLPAARVDAALVRQVFVNLLGNALKFTGGRPDPQVRVQAARSDDGQVLIEVRDNGVGFAPERASELFQPFRRLHGAQFGGTGVGLTIVRRIVERHGGRVWAQGRPGEGASFYFTLPAGALPQGNG